MSTYSFQFLSTPSARRATEAVCFPADHHIISIHALREEGDAAGLSYGRWRFISIHALREEGDMVLQKLSTVTSYFYPRPPRGGRRAVARPNGTSFHISIHALREEGDAHRRDQSRGPHSISIHALREEGDRVRRAANDSKDKFLSTPSARRATLEYEGFTASQAISIHALREEGDPSCSTSPCRPLDFYPRPPRGGRRSTTSTSGAFTIFLSTPSARRATAKTETKSLFSNKLYNILHEFRRALIYNGSKNYPNHAK